MNHEAEFQAMTLKEDIKKARQEVVSLEAQINGRLVVKKEAVDRRRTVERFYRRKAALEHKIRTKKAASGTLSGSCAEVRASNERRRGALLLAKGALQRARAEQVENGLEPAVPALLWNNTLQAKRLRSVRVEMIQQLVNHFQLEETPDGRVRIVGIFLNPDRLHDAKLGGNSRGAPDDGTTFDELSTGLGYVVHFVNCVCQYLCLVPPYRMDFKGSASEVYGLDGTRYVLEAKKGSKTFAVALHMVESNVCWLCGLAGVPRKGRDDRGRRKEQQILDNLRRLVRAPRLGMEGPLRVMPSAIVAAQQLDYNAGSESPPPPEFVAAATALAPRVPSLQAGPNGGVAPSHRNGNYHIPRRSVDPQQDQADEAAAISILADDGISSDIMALTNRAPGEGVASPRVHLRVAAETELRGGAAAEPLRSESSGSPGAGHPTASWNQGQPNYSPAKAYRATADNTEPPTPRMPGESVRLPPTQPSNRSQSTRMLESPGVEEAAPDNRPLTLIVEPGEFVPAPSRTLQIRASSKVELLACVAAELGLGSVTLEVYDEDFEEWCMPTNLDAFGEVSDVTQVRVTSAISK